MAQSAPHFNGRNRLLAALSETDAGFLLPLLEAVDLPVRRTLETPDKRIDHVYFLDRGIASVVGSGNHDGVAVEVGLIGREGMSGATVVMGNHRSPQATYMQAPGAGHRLKAADLRAAMAKRPSIQAVFLKYVQTFMIQTAHTAIANSRAKLDQRLARWALMAHDRIEGDELPLTHEFLATMLGVRRAGVTTAVHALEQHGLIEATRGRLVICDREGLEEMAGTFYGVPEAELKRLLGRFRPGE